MDQTKNDNPTIVEKIETVIPTTKLGIQKLATDIIKQLDDGEVNPLELLKSFKMIGKLEELVKEKMIKMSIAEAAKYPEKEIELFGVTFKQMEAGVKFDYSQCNDVQYKAIIQTEAKLIEEKKSREAFLKGIQGHIIMETVDTDSGEVKNEKVYAPARTSTTTIQVTIK